MGDMDWTRRVFRLRKLPSSVSSPDEAASFLAEALGITAADVVVYSLATTSDVWEMPPSKVATVQLKTVPASPPQKTKDSQWEIPVPRNSPHLWLLLDTHFEGMTALNDVDPSEYHTDCIAISGLGSHAFGTWQPSGADKTFMWIRDEIPRSVPGVRAIVYGYESKLAGSQSFQSVNDIALRLIHQLKSVRSLTSAKSIVFLAHSLGGLVLKDAIIQMANAANEGFRGILDKVKGAIMFGVPSLGMQQAHLMAMVDGQANEVLIQDLSRENGTAYLRQRNKQFEGISYTRKMRIFWAYETEESPTVVERPDGTWAKDGDPTVLVNPDSATCYYNRNDKTVTIPINKDHSNMVKFARGDANLSSILVSLLELCSQASPARGPPYIPQQGPQASQVVQHKEPDEDDFPTVGNSPISAEDDKMMARLGDILTSIDELHQTLYTPELHSRAAEIVDPFPNTFNWIFRQSIFSRWLQQGSELFWIHGKPGSGKSTLMKYIVRSEETSQLLHNWRRSSHEIQAEFFFHHRGTAIQKSFEGVLRSLITQILSPHRKSFQREHQSTWVSFQDLKRALASCETRDRITRAQLHLLKTNLRSMKDAPQRHLSERVYEFEQKRKTVQKELEESAALMAGINSDLKHVVDVFRPFERASRTTLLAELIAQYRETGLGQIPMLEKLLRLLVDQDVIDLDLFVFVDALDEFDGNLHIISRFLKGLVQASARSTTRVKVCFSSRPWEVFKDHFSPYPSFSLQEHTKRDVEDFTAGSLANLRKTSPIIGEFIPEIIARANGVFLWVKLVVPQLAGTVARHGARTTHKQLQKTLQELPDDLDEFYKLIIRRIAEPNPRRTFALLELLLRHEGPAPTAAHIRDAVLTSECATMQQALDELDVVYSNCPPAKMKKRIRDDIATWGGGLVEIKSRMGTDWPQLMHQTVLEFTMSLEFKKLVLCHLASLVHENGHSFHMKYLVLSRCLAEGSESDEESTQLVPSVHEERMAKDMIAYHAKKSEVTTGKSHINFISSIPPKELRRFPVVHHTLKDLRSGVLAFAASYGLSLCLRDWLRADPHELGRLSLQPIQLPLLSSIILRPASEVFQWSYISMAYELCAKRFSLQRDPLFFPDLLNRLRKAENNEPEDTPKIPVKALTKLAILVLKYGQDSNAIMKTFAPRLHQHRPLHIATPEIARHLIEHGGDVNARDSKDRTPLDWTVHFPDELHDLGRRPLNDAARFKLCTILKKHEGVAPHTSKEAWVAALSDFDAAGCNTHHLRKELEGLLSVTVPQASIMSRLPLHWFQRG